MASPSLERLTAAAALDRSIVIRSPSMQHLMSLAERIASSPAAVLIQGETGTGKEFVAHALHNLSHRRTKPFVEVNCAAIPEHLMESELFGYEKGAYSGAQQTKPGFFELADAGTLFLDEVGELDPRLQAKLLRVLDGAPYYRLGGTQKITIDVRVVAATNRDLKSAVGGLTFRPDLYFRLSQLQLKVPPLRTRPEDLEGITDRLLQTHRPGTQLAPDAKAALFAYSWPGNIRELRGVIMNTMLTMPEDVKIVHAADLPHEVHQHLQSPDTEEVHIGDLDNMERSMIDRALQDSAGDQAVAAAKLGISRRTLSRKLKALRTPPPSEIGDEASGSMNKEQARYFRASLQRPVLIRTANGDQSVVESNDLSTSGVGVKSLGQHPDLNGSLVLEFDLGTEDAKIHAKGKVIWTNAEGDAGIRFVSMTRSSQELIRRFVAASRVKEGWNATV